jgi:Tol biopolymer transport system component
MRPLARVRLGLAMATLVVTVLGSLGAADRSTSAVVGTTAGGSRILYASSWTGRMQIYAVDPSGKAAVAQLTFGTDARCSADQPPGVPGLLPDGYVQPLPSPNGRYVLYRCMTHTMDRSHWMVARADGRVPRGLATDSWAAAWSPDSTRVVYSTAGGLHAVRPDGSGDRILTRGGGPAAFALSRDGKAIATVGPHLSLVRDGRTTLLRRDAGFELAWSPDGRWIATWSARHDGEVLLTRPSGARGPRVGLGVLAAWSPDGRRLAYEAPDGLRVLDVRTGQRRLLTPETAYSLRPFEIRPLGLSWAPDGRSLAYVAGTLDPGDGIQSGDLRTVTLAGRTRTVVALNGRYGGRMLSPVWTRVSSRLRYRNPEPSPTARVTGTDVLADGAITRLAADGRRVAFAACLGAFVWTPATRTVTEIYRREWADHAGPATCLQPDRSYVYSLAAAGNRVAYGERVGCTGRLTLGLGVVGANEQAAELGHSNVTCAAPMKPALADLQGAGELLVYSTAEEHAPCCPLGTISTAVQTVHRVGAAGCPCPALASSPGPYIPADVEAGRIVVYGDNETHVLDRDGKRIVTVPLSPVAAQLSGSRLVLLLRGQLRVYDAVNGTLQHTWPLPDVPSGAQCQLRCSDAARLVLQDVAGGLAAYILDGKVHVLRLADGADAVVASGTLARFMDEGLVYADGWRLHLVTFDRVPLR